MLTVINGTNRIGNKSIEISKAILKYSKLESRIVTLDNFKELFIDEYITLETANSDQLNDLKQIIDSDILIFVVPVYHHGIPSALKNFIDIVDIQELFSKKSIGFISANKSSRDGARQAMQCVSGYASYHKSKSVFISPTIPMIDPLDIDGKRIVDFLELIYR